MLYVDVQLSPCTLSCFYILYLLACVHYIAFISLSIMAVKLYRSHDSTQVITLVNIHLWKLLWVYCPGHAWVKGKDRADRLAGRAALTSGSLLGRSEVLRSLRHYLGAQSQGHHTTDRLEERGVERGSARRSSLKGRERAIVNHTNIGTVSKATLGKLLRDRVERIWAFRAHRYHLQLN